MKIGLSAFAWTSTFRDSHAELIPRVRELGFSAMEVPMFDPKSLPVDRIRQAFEANDLECTVCAILPRGINPISPNPAMRSDAIKHLKECVDAAAAMGAKLLGGPLFAPIGYLPEHRPTDNEWSWAAEAFQSLRSTLRATDVQISIEPVNRSETFFVRTAADAARLCDLVGDSHIGVTIDTFHANIEEPSIPGAIRSLGSRLLHIHASENDRGPLGRGHIPFAEIISALHEIDYEGCIMIEGFGFQASETESPGFLWAYEDVSPEELASESHRYLLRLMTN